MNIDVRIPYDSNRDVGAAYNRALATVEDWVLFIDHDVFLVNDMWHAICQDAIKSLGHRAGWISCRTNAVACPHQVIKGHLKNHDLGYHMEIAKNLEMAYPGVYTDVTDVIVPLSGFFILTHRKAWQNAGGFPEGFPGIDNEYHRRLAKAGYRIFIMEELYCYHRYKRFWADDNTGVPKN